MACPFFLPTERLIDGAWLHIERLPLGCGWSGHCTAPGHAGSVPSPQELQEFCNLGYAESCTRLPQDRPWDSVRFAAKIVNTNAPRILLRYVCERSHRPAEDGTLEFDATAGRWDCPHRDPCVQRMAECFLESFVEKKKRREIERAAS
ncbi:MAG: hypothetical protein WBX38_15475 [Candidatus Sulfotelmatobacter sp.]